MKTIKDQFDLHTRLFNNVLENISDSDAGERLNEKINHLKWLAGHVTNVRLSFLKLVGETEDTSLDEFFSHGKSINADVKYPTIEVIKEKWVNASDKVESALMNIPERVLASNPPVDVPFGDKTMKGFLGFLMHHEAYHIGQMGILRKYLGNKAMSYK